MSQEEAAVYMNLSRRKVRSETRPNGRLKCVRIGRRVLYRPDDCDAWLTQNLTA